VKMPTSTHRLHQHETDSSNTEFDFDAFAPVLMMSCIGLTLSLLIITLVAK
jgi:hypothetical protein